MRAVAPLVLSAPKDQETDMNLAAKLRARRANRRRAAVLRHLSPATLRDIGMAPDASPLHARETNFAIYFPRF